MASAIDRHRRESAAFQPSDTELARPDGAGVVTGLPLVLLRSEGVAVLAMATLLYGRYGRSWWLFLALLPVPDLGLLGQLRSKHAGAVAYDLTHTYAPPASLGLVGVITGSGLAALAVLDGGRLLDADGRFRIETAREEIGRRLHRVPRFRQLLYRPRFGLGWPLWVDAPSIDLAEHVREFPLRARADEAQLLAA